MIYSTWPSSLEKLASFTDATIDEAAVSAVVGVRKGESLSTLLDAIAARDATTALAVLPGVLQLPKVNPVTLVMSLTTQMLAIGYGQAVLARGGSRQSLYNEFVNLVKETGAFLNRPWGEAFTAWTKSAAQWSSDDIDAALAVLLDTDVALKDTKISSEEQVVTSLVLALCGARAERSVTDR